MLDRAQGFQVVLTRCIFNAQSFDGFVRYRTAIIALSALLSVVAQHELLRYTYIHIYYIYTHTHTHTHVYTAEWHYICVCVQARTD